MVRWKQIGFQVLPEHPGPSNAAEGPALCLWTVVWIYSRPYVSTDSIVFRLWGDRRVTNCRKPNPMNFPMQILDLLIFFADICSHTSRRLSRNPRRPCVTDISQSPGTFHIYFPPVATETLYSRGDGALTCSLGMQILSLRLCDSKMEEHFLERDVTEALKSGNYHRRVFDAVHGMFSVWFEKI